MVSQHLIILYGSLQKGNVKNIYNSLELKYLYQILHTIHIISEQPTISIKTYKLLAKWPISHTCGKHSMKLVFWDITPCMVWKFATYTFKVALITSVYSVIHQQTLVTLWQLQITHAPQIEELLSVVNVFYATERKLLSFTTNDERKW